MKSKQHNIMTLFSSRGRQQLRSEEAVRQGGRLIDSLDIHRHLENQYGKAATLASNPSSSKEAWFVLQDLLKTLRTSECKSQYFNFWKRTEGEKEYSELLNKVYKLYQSTGIYWMSRSNNLTDRVMAIPYTSGIRCTMGEYCMARLGKDYRDKSLNIVRIEPSKGGVDYSNLESSLSDIATICGFHSPQIVKGDNFAIVQEDLEHLELVSLSKSEHFHDRLKAMSVALNIRDEDGYFANIDVVGNMAMLTATSKGTTLSIIKVRSMATSIADFLGVKKVKIDVSRGVISISEDTSRIEAIAHATSESNAVKAQGLCINLDVRDTEGDLCQVVWYESDAGETLKFLSSNGYLKQSTIEPFLVDVAEYMNWESCDIKQESGTVNVVKDLSIEHLTELTSSDLLVNRVEAMPYYFNLKDITDGDVSAFYEPDDNFIHLKSISGRAISFSTVNSLIPDIESYLNWKGLLTTRYKNGIMIHDHHCKESSVYIPSSYSMSDILTQDTATITYGVTNGNKAVTVPLSKINNMIVVGTQGSGKSNFLKGITYQLTRNIGSGIDEIYAIDVKELLTFGPLAQLENCHVTDNPGSAIEFLETVTKEVKSRNQVASEQKTPDGVYPGGHLFLLIEEYSDFIKTITDAGKDIGKVRTLIERILKTGRSAKVRVIIGLQKTDQKIIDKGVKDQFSNSFLFNVPDKGYADSLFDGADVVADKGWRPVALPKGRCIVQLSGENDIFQMQTPLIENDDFLERIESLEGYMGRE